MRSRFDRLAIFIKTRLNRSVTAVVGIDDDSAPLVAAIAGALSRRSILVVVTGSPERPCIVAARAHGARVVTVDFARTDSWASLRLFRKARRAVPARCERHPQPHQTRGSLRGRRDEQPHATAGRRAHRRPVAGGGLARRAVRPGTVGGRPAGDRWARDTVGIYEVTARKLVDEITDGASRRSSSVAPLS